MAVVANVGRAVARPFCFGTSTQICAVVHNVREALELLRRDGWLQVSQRGSHRQFKHSTKPGKVTVPGKPSDEIPPDTWYSILRQAGIK